MEENRQDCVLQVSSPDRNCQSETHGKHLDILVENTERLTKLLVSNMIETRESDLESMQSDNDPLITLVSEDDEEDDEMDEEYVAENVKDDERTFVAAEAEESLVEIESEIATLKSEADIPVEELRQRYWSGEVAEVKRSEFAQHLHEDKQNTSFKFSEFELISKPGLQVRDSDSSWKHVILYRRRVAPNKGSVVISYRNGIFEGLKGNPYRLDMKASSFDGNSGVLYDGDGQVIETRSKRRISRNQNVPPVDDNIITMEDEEEVDEAFVFYQEDAVDDETTMAEAEVGETSRMSRTRSRS